MSEDHTLNAGDPSPGAAGEPAAPRDDAARVSALEAELASVKDRLLRTLADQENGRRRTQRELQDVVKFAVSDLARDLLATADNLRRALDSVPPERAGEPTVRQLLAGVAATERALLDALSKHDIHRVAPLGELFDPNRHQAIFEAPDADHPAGTVIEVLEPGYLHHDRLLRPAMVGVAKETDRAA